MQGRKSWTPRSWFQPWFLRAQRGIKGFLVGDTFWKPCFFHCNLSGKTNKQAKLDVGGCYICPNEVCLGPDLEMIVDGEIITRETSGPQAWLYMGWRSRVLHRWLYIQSLSVGTIPTCRTKGQVDFLLLDHSHCHPNLWEGKAAWSRHLARSTGLVLSC